MDFVCKEDSTQWGAIVGSGTQEGHAENGIGGNEFLLFCVNQVRGRGLSLALFLQHLLSQLGIVILATV